jgi:hypothetical protein
MLWELRVLGFTLFHPTCILVLFPDAIAPSPIFSPTFSVAFGAINVSAIVAKVIGSIKLLTGETA